MASFEPSAEYHTRSTGPDASPANPKSMEELPTWRQSVAGCAASVPQTSTRRAPVRVVSLCHMERVHCILYDRRFGSQAHDSPLNSFRAPTCKCTFGGKLF